MPSTSSRTLKPSPRRPSRPPRTPFATRKSSHSRVGLRAQNVEPLPTGVALLITERPRIFPICSRAPTALPGSAILDLPGTSFELSTRFSCIWLSGKSQGVTPRL